LEPGFEFSLQKLSSKSQSFFPVQKLSSEVSVQDTSFSLKLSPIRTTKKLFPLKVSKSQNLPKSTDYEDGVPIQLRSRPIRQSLQARFRVAWVRPSIAPPSVSSTKAFFGVASLWTCDCMTAEEAAAPRSCSGPTSRRRKQATEAQMKFGLCKAAAPATVLATGLASGLETSSTSLPRAVPPFAPLVFDRVLAR
jgi:hypothetical protein